MHNKCNIGTSSLLAATSAVATSHTHPHLAALLFATASSRGTSNRGAGRNRSDFGTRSRGRSHLGAGRWLTCLTARRTTTCLAALSTAFRILDGAFDLLDDGLRNSHNGCQYRMLYALACLAFARCTTSVSDIDEH